MCVSCVVMLNSENKTADMRAKSQTEVSWKYMNKQGRNTGRCSVEYLLPGCFMFWVQVLREEIKKRA